MFRILLFSFALLLLLGGCGGGGGRTAMRPMDPPRIQQPNDDQDTGQDDDTDEDQDQEQESAPVDTTETETETQPTAEFLPFPLEPWACNPDLAHISGACGGEGTTNQAQHTSGLSGLSAPAQDEAKHMPVYGDTDNNDRRLFVGIDQGTAHIGSLPIVASRPKAQIRHGTVNDGVGRSTVTQYLQQMLPGDVQRYETPPSVRLIGPANKSDLQHLTVAVQLVNAALPEEAKVTIEAPLPGMSLRDTVTNGLLVDSSRQLDNTIHVEFVPAGTFHSTSAATTWNRPTTENDGIASSYIQFNKGANSYPSSPNDRVPSRQALILLAHELVHALGLFDHVSSSFASVMRDTAAIHEASQNGQRQPMSFLYPVDREALQILYGELQNGDSVTSLGPWASSSLHIHGNTEHAGFGVAFRNGYAEPWAYGYKQSSYRTLAEDMGATGTATWDGNLVGLTPERAAVVGDAEIAVNLGTLTGTADFTSLETWGPGVAPGAAGSGAIWLDGDLNYSIEVGAGIVPPGQAGRTQYTFTATGGDDGRLSGIFVGANHEGATGTLERSDLTAAFGATR